MKAFIACLGTETNTFSPIPTGMRNFEETMLFHGDATQHEPNLFSEPLHVWRAAAEARNWDVVESVAAFAQPAGPTVGPVYEALRDELLTDLKNALPVDMVLLCMHGAMVAEGYLDCEGDILQQVRQIVGPNVAVGCELDLHCSVTPRMTENADVIITFKEYPHVDGKERAQELFDVLIEQVVGDTNPTISSYDTRMINMWRTPIEPMASVVERMQALEGQDGVLSVSFAHGFPWGDVPDASAKVLVVTDGNAAKGDALAQQLGEEIWALRHATSPTSVGIEEALQRAQAAASGPVVLADVSDNAGGGAPSDSTYMLQALLDKSMQGVLSGLYWDPIAVRMCQEAGEGSSFELRVGGKCGRASGMPVDLMVTVNKIVEAASQTFGTSRNNMGDAVWLSADGIDLVLNSIRTQTFHPDAFEQFGIDIRSYKTVVVKSTQHFYAGFAPLATEVIYVAAPGSIPPDFANIPFKEFSAPYWPRVDDPFD